MNEIILTPEQFPVLSKENAASFHNKMKDLIYERGNGLAYIETIKFFAALDKQINGDKAAKIEPDNEFIDYVRDEIKNFGAGKDFTTQRGVKFSLAETGTTYDFSQCNSPELEELENEAKNVADKLKAHKEMLKTIPLSGMDVITKDGENVKLYPPSKFSKSSFKVTLPK
jgi:hypothetical protein